MSYGSYWFTNTHWRSWWVIFVVHGDWLALIEYLIDQSILPIMRHNAIIVSMLLSLLYSSRRSVVSGFAATQLTKAFQTTSNTARHSTSSSKTTETETTIPKPLEVDYTMDNIVNLCKRRGIIFPSSEIYGGFAGFYDYGGIGVELKNNVKKLWWRTFVTKREDIVGLDSSILHNPAVWKASGALIH